ncbi:hypothetical protein J0H58_11645 [bacterium]|nr:hypothetical protein [bacterium]
MTRWQIACAIGLITASLVAAQPTTDPARLREEAHAARREQVELLLQDAARGWCHNLPAAAAAVRRLADEAAERGGPAAGAVWAEKWAAALRADLDRIKAAHTLGGGIKGHLLGVQEARVDAEIDLARRRGAGLVTLVPLYRERVELLTEVEKLTELVVERGGGTRADALSRKVARLDAAAELAAAEAAAKKGGR